MHHLSHASYSDQMSKKIRHFQMWKPEKSCFYSVVMLAVMMGFVALLEITTSVTANSIMDSSTPVTNSEIVAVSTGTASVAVPSDASLIGNAKVGATTLSKAISSSPKMSDEVTPIVQVNTTDGLVAALSDSNDETIQITAPITLTSSVIVTGSKTLIGDGTSSLILSGYTITISTGAILTIGDENDTHLIKILATPSSSSAGIQDNGTLIVNDGADIEATSDSTGYLIAVTGTFTGNGGAVINNSLSTTTPGTALRLNSGANANISNGIYSGNVYPITVTTGATLSSISGGAFDGNNTAHSSGMVIYNNGGTIGTISGGTFNLNGGGYAVLYNNAAGTIGEISGGNFDVTGSLTNYNSGSIGIDNLGTITTISGSSVVANGAAIYVSNGGKINEISGGNFESGVVGLEVMGEVDLISGGAFYPIGTPGALFEGMYIGNIANSGNPLGLVKTISGGSFGIDLSTGSITATRGIYNLGEIDLISGGNIAGNQAAIQSGDTFQGDDTTNFTAALNNIVGGNFLGVNGPAIEISHPLNLEQGLLDSEAGYPYVGEGRYQGKDGVIFAKIPIGDAGIDKTPINGDDSFVTYPYKPYQMSGKVSASELAVSGFDQTFQYLTYSITLNYDKNDPNAAGTTNSSNIIWDKNGIAAANGFTNSGKVFAGWNTSADGNGTSYQPNASVVMNNTDLTLYAQWKEVAVNPPLPETGTVKVHYVDEAGNPIALDNMMSDTVGQPYSTSAKTIDSYTLKTIPANANGTYTSVTIDVTYVYTKKPGVPPTTPGNPGTTTPEVPPTTPSHPGTPTTPSKPKPTPETPSQPGSKNPYSSPAKPKTAQPKLMNTTKKMATEAATLPRTGEKQNNFVVEGSLLLLLSALLRYAFRRKKQ